jgi:hypothetical protein
MTKKTKELIRECEVCDIVECRDKRIKKLEEALLTLKNCACADDIEFIEKALKEGE